MREILLDTWNYLQCTTTGDNSDPSRVDVFALNSYSWCGYSSYTMSQYNVLVANFSTTSVPVFFSEYGCIVPSPRVFTEVPVIYGPQMTAVLSGGMVYEYSEEPSDYGLVVINSNGSAQILPDYNTLQTQFNTLNVTALQGLPAQNTTNKAPTCSSSLITSPSFYNNFTIPAVPPGAQDLIDNGIANPNNGKLVAVTSTKVTQVVQQTNGDIIQGLAITPLADDESNNPSGQSPSSTTSAAPAATTTKKSDASTVRGCLRVLGGVLVLAVSWTFLI